MVNKSANIKKMNNDLSPQIIEKRPQHVALEIQVLAWDRYKNVVGLNMGSQTFPSCGGIKHINGIPDLPFMIILQWQYKC